MKEADSHCTETAVLQEKRQTRERDLQSAKFKAQEADHICTRIQALLPKVSNWESASRQKVLEAFKLLPKIQNEFDKMNAAYQAAEKDGFGQEIPGVNMSVLREIVNRLQTRVKNLTTQVTAENIKVNSDLYTTLSFQ